MVGELGRKFEKRKEGRAFFQVFETLIYGRSSFRSCAHSGVAGRGLGFRIRDLPYMMELMHPSASPGGLGLGGVRGYLGAFDTGPEYCAAKHCGKR